MRRPGDIVLLATYELGHQPLSLAWPAAALARAGYAPRLVDLAVETLPTAALAQARLVAVATPMQTALRLAVPLLRQVRALNPSVHLCAYGLYAGLNASYLLGQAGAARLVDSVLSGEIEDDLVALVQRLATASGALRSDEAPPPTRRRLLLPIPERASLPPLERYARLVWQGEMRLAGAAESSRGCRHTCRHCPLTPIYGGRFFAVPLPTVLADIRQQVAVGAQHITFTDPDFLNGPTHALRLARAMRSEFPGLTFDATIKIEHILQHRACLAELAELGCLFVVSAVESLSDEVLRRLAKGHTRADVFAALRVLDELGIALRPSLLAFTPWTTLADYCELLDWVEVEGLEEHIDPVHFAIRLLVPPGSALLDDLTDASWLGPLDAANFSYTWRHPDPRMDELYTAVAAQVSAMQDAGRTSAETLQTIRSLAEAQRGGPLSGRGRTAVATRSRRPPPRLTESWFC